MHPPIPLLRVKRFLVNLALAVGSIAALVVALEVIFRFVRPPAGAYPFQPGMVVLDGNAWVLAAGFRGVMDNGVDFRGKVVTVDAAGARITPASVGIAAPGRKVLVFGDSETFGQGLSDDETWPNRLQQRLSADGLGDIAVRNLGVPGINVDQYAARLQRLAPSLRPGDAVVVGMSWNDLMAPGGETQAMQVVDGYLVRRSADADSRAAEWRIRLYQRTGFVMPQIEDLKGFLIGLADNSALASYLLPHARALYYRLRPIRNPYQPFLDAEIPRKNFWLLEGMRADAKWHGASFLVVLLPFRIFFEDATWRLYSRDGQIMAPQNYMAALALPLCAEFRISCVDTFPILHRHQKEGMAFAQDGHYTAKAATLIAAEVAPALADLMREPAPSDR